jgi:hypothetical protein
MKLFGQLLVTSVNCGKIIVTMGKTAMEKKKHAEFSLPAWVQE